MILHIILSLAVLLLVVYLVYSLIRDHKSGRHLGWGRLLLLVIILIALLSHCCHYMSFCGHGHCC